MERKNYATSEQTKHELGKALKELMTQKPLNKISIHDLTDRCGMYRQNFYYHFEDVYDLLRWVIQQEAISLLRQHEGAMLWQEGLLQLFRYLDENREFCCAILRSVGREHIIRFVEGDIYEIIRRTVDQICAEIGIENLRAQSADPDMVTRFYVIALAGTMENWLLGRIERTPEELIAFADQMLQDQLSGVKMRLKKAEFTERVEPENPEDPEQRLE